MQHHCCTRGYSWKEMEIYPPEKLSPTFRNSPMETGSTSAWAWTSPSNRAKSHFQIPSSISHSPARSSKAQNRRFTRPQAPPPVITKMDRSPFWCTPFGRAIHFGKPFRDGCLLHAPILHATKTNQPVRMVITILTPQLLFSWPLPLRIRRINRPEASLPSHKNLPLLQFGRQKNFQYCSLEVEKLPLLQFRGGSVGETGGQTSSP